MPVDNRPLGRRLNEARHEVWTKLREVRSIVADILENDEDLPRNSRLTESHLDDVKRAIELIDQAGALLEALTPEALENHD